MENTGDALIGLLVAQGAVLVDKIEASINPRYSGKALKGNDKEWRYRVGDYWLVCEIRDRELIVWIVRVGLAVAIQ